MIVFQSSHLTLLFDQHFRELKNPLCVFSSSHVIVLLLVAACGCLWLLVAVCGCLWLFVAACGCLWLFVPAWGCLWLLVAVRPHDGCLLGSAVVQTTTAIKARSEQRIQSPSRFIHLIHWWKRWAQFAQSLTYDNYVLAIHSID